MTSPTFHIANATDLPMIDAAEVAALAARYGTPAARAYVLQADEYIRSYRWRSVIDRRAEVVFAIQTPADLVWLHTKANYPRHIYRLPSGGINLAETVEAALFREVEEETSLNCTVERFLGLQSYQFRYGEETADFASYIFALRTDSALPVCQREDELSGFRAVLPSQLLGVSSELRNLIGSRHSWGQWRALAVDLVYEELTR